MRELYVVIPATDRHKMISDLLAGMDQPADHVILVDNGSRPPLAEVLADRAMVIDNRGSALNIQAWWNLGWAEVESLAVGPYAIAFLNSDALISKRDIETMTEALDLHNAAAVGTDHCHILSPGQIYRKQTPGPVEWAHRLSGYGFVVRGELKSRFDESLEWWYGDDDFEWRARTEFGGVIILGGTQVQNLDSNGAQRDRPELNVQIDKDRINFINKWGTASQDWTIYNIGAYNARLSRYRSTT